MEYQLYRKLIPDRIMLKHIYRKVFGKELDLRNPKTFNEKLQWLKLYDRKPVYTRMVDKYEAKKYAADLIGEEYIIPTIGVWNRFDEIDFSTLPDRFVLKCTHDSGGIVICRDKNAFNAEKSGEIIEESLKQNFYWIAREWPYKNVKPRIIAEQYLEDNESGGLADYKIHCFNGKPRLILVCNNRYNGKTFTEDFFDTDWNFIPVKRPGIMNSDIPMDKPDNLQQMLALAESLAEGISFVRADFYSVRNRIYFGELTFSPAGGFVRFEPESYDDQFGELLRLPGA